MRKFLLKLVSKLIEIVEAHELRHLPLDEHDPSKKVIETLSFTETEYLTKSDTGWHPIANLFRLQPYTEWVLETESGKKIVCADHHLLFTPDYKVIRTDNLYAGDLILTEDGVEKVKMCYPTTNKSSMYDCEIMSSDHRYFTNKILSHNTVTSAIFITWYLLFNVDKNVIVLANKGATAAEILDKIKAVFKGLPFFLKPGIVQNNVMTMRFDNGCRVMGQATTKTAAIGFTIHLAYMDEFAHIQPSFLEPFYRSVYPTIAASQISKVIITSTPHGRNKFYDIYQGAVEKKNEYVPIRVDWWQVPGRDEKWKAREIANLGSEELFNQEYGNQFLAGDTLLLGGDALRAMKKIVKEYIWQEIDVFEDEDINYKDLKWHPKFSFYDVKPDDKFVFSIDIADGAGRDYSVINIFRVEKLSKAAIRKVRRDRLVNEASFFRLVQIGMFRSNKAGAEELSKITGILIFKVFGADRVRAALEMNFKGDYFIEKISKYQDYYEDIFLHTKHNENHKHLSLGIKLHKHNKMFFCREFRKLVMEKRIVLNEQITFEEMNDFGINSRGTYSSQSSHDDVAMTCVNLVPFSSSDSFEGIVEEVYDDLEESFKTLIQNRLAESGNDKGDNDSLSYLKDLL
jgi:hypothetical protein